MTAREHHLEQIHTQLVHWQEHQASRVEGEAGSLDIEIGKLHDNELEDSLRLLRPAHTKILAGCDIVRDLRQRLQGRHQALVEGSVDPPRRWANATTQGPQL